ncbi:type I secretion C-terminal target domain-containing protein [Acinetobacter wuhouensis]|nr:type I secretion C-terminal target domain-containing protein [Acinetobacter wuhouensis]
MSRPLQDNETITIIATDTSGNKTPETINVGDVTKPEVSVDIVDENTIQIDSNEPGSKVEITDSAGNKIAEGIIDENGQLIVDVDKPLNPGDKIIVNVTDEAGNKTTEEVPIDEFTGGGNSGSADKQPPVFESADVNTLGQIELHYSEELDADNLPAANQFVVKVDGKTIPAENITVSVIDQQVILTLNPPIYTGQTVTVSYQDATVGDDLNAIQDLRGNDAADLPETALTNKSTVVDPTDKTPPIIKTEVTDATHIEVTSNESGTVEIKDVAGNVIGSGTITGNDTPDNIQLTRPLVDGETVTVVVTDAAKNEGKETVKVGDVTAPILTNTSVNVDGELVLSFNEPLDEDNPPQATDFTILIGGVLTAPSTVTVEGKDVILTFDPPIYAGQSVQVIYKDPTAGDDIQAIQDIDGKDAASFNETVKPLDNHSTQQPPTTPDTVAPLLKTAVVDPTGKIILTFDEALAGEAATVEDFKVMVDGQAVTVQSVEVIGDTVTVVTSPVIPAGSTVVVSYKDVDTSDGTTDNGVLEDAAGNDVVSFDKVIGGSDNGSTQQPPTTPDTVAPLLKTAVVDPTGKIILTFDEALAGEAATVEDFKVMVDGQAVTVQSVEVIGDTVTVVTSPVIPAGSTVVVSYKDVDTSDGTTDNGVLEDAAGNDVVSFDKVIGGSDNGSTQQPPTTPDTVAPLLKTAVVDPTGKIILTFDEALAGEAATVEDFKVMVDGQAVTVQSVEVIGDTVTVVTSPVIPAGSTVVVSYKDVDTSDGTTDNGVLEDAAGNDVVSFDKVIGGSDNGSTQQPPTTPDTVAPLLKTAVVDPTGKIILTFDEALAGEAATVEDFKVMVDGQAVTVQSVEVIGDTVTVVTSPVIPAGSTVVVSYKDVDTSDGTTDNGVLEDAAGNDVVSFDKVIGGSDNGSTQQPPTTPDTVAPLLKTAVVDPTGKIILTFDEALAGEAATVEDFKVMVDGQAVTVQSVEVIGDTVTVVTSPVIPAGSTVVVSYKDVDTSDGTTDNGVLEDAAGNDVVSFDKVIGGSDNGSTQQPPTTPDTVAPLLKTAVVDPTGKIILTFDEALAGEAATVEDFKVMVDGQAVTVQSVEVIGDTVTVVTSPVIPAGSTVVVSYKDVDTSDGTTDNGVLEDAAGNDVVSFDKVIGGSDNGSTQVPPTTETPPILLSSVATPEGEIILTFDQALSSDLPNASSFVLLVNGQSVTIDSISFTDTTHESIVLHTSPAIPKDAIVSLIYMDPTSSDDANAIQNVNGLDGASFQVVVNTLNGLDPLLAKNDFNTVDFGLESVAVWDDIINAHDTKVIELLSSNTESSGVEFTLPKNGDSTIDYSSDVLITIQQQDLLSVATGFSVIIMRKNDQGEYEQYAVKTVQNGGVIADSSLLQVLGIVGDGNTIAVSLDDLPEGDYKAVIASDQSVLSDVLTELTLAELASGEKLLGAENEELVINTLKALLEAKGQGNLLSTVVVGLVSGLLDTVNGVRLDVLVKALTDLPILKNVLNAADFITGIVAGLVASTLTIYEQTDITISGKDYYFEPKTITGSLYEEVNKPQNDDLLGYQASAKVTLIQILDSSGQVIATQTIDPQDAETEIVGLYGTFTLYTDGTYSYSANGSHVSIGQKEYINYTISDGYNQDSSAQLQITIRGQNQTPVTPSGQELYATTDIKVGHLEIIPTITNIAQTGNDITIGGYVAKKTGFITVGLDLGPVLDLGLLESSSNTGNQNVGIRLSVGSGKVEELNIKADVGGVVIGTMDFYVYKLNVTTGYYEQYLAKPDWFGAFLGGVSPLTPLTLTEGDYVLLMNAGSGLAALTGYTLYVINEKVYDYNSVDGIKLDGSTNLTLEGNVLTDNSGYGVDKLTTDAKLYAVNGVKFGSDTSITVNGKYGTLTINQDGTYSYTINPTATGYVGQKDTFSYTLYDAKLGLSSTANLIIDLTTLNLKADFDAVQLVNTADPIVVNANLVNASPLVTLSDVNKTKTYNYNFTINPDNLYHDTNYNIKVTRTGLGGGTFEAKIINKITNEVIILKEPTSIGTGITISNLLGNLSSGEYQLVITLVQTSGVPTYSLDANIKTTTSGKYIEADSTTAVVKTGNIFSNDDLGSVTTHGKVLISGKEMYLNSTITQDSSSLTITGSYGTLVLEKSGNYTYTANGSGYGIDKFTYTIVAADGTSEQAVLSINVGSKFVGSIYQDMLYSTAGNDTISTSGSSDTVIFKLLSNTDATGGNGKDTWTDFHVGNVTTDAEADKVDLSALLIGFNSANITSDLTASTAYLKNYLGVKVDGDDVTLTIDRDGAGTAYTVKTDLLQMNGLAQTGAAFNGKTEDDILKLLLQNHQLGF